MELLPTSGGRNSGSSGQNEPRPTDRPPPISCYLAFGFAAVAVVAEGSAKAITASPDGVYVSAVFV